MTKRTLTIAFLLTFALNAFAQSNEKTFTKAFNTEGRERIKLDLPGPVDLKVWNKPTIRMEITVSLANGNVSMLDQLAKVGRYNLKSEPVEDLLPITAPNLYREVRVKGVELRENVSYVVFVPKDMEVILHAPPAVATVEK